MGNCHSDSRLPKVSENDGTQKKDEKWNNRALAVKYAPSNNQSMIVVFTRFEDDELE